MADTNKKIIAVVGATGAQGGGLVRAILEDPKGGFAVRAITRDVNSDKARALAVAKEVGLDMAKLEKDMASPEARATIEENFKLAESMGMNGTPSYVIGKQVVIGAVGVESLREKISNARCGKATC